VTGARPPLVSVVVPVYNGEAFLAEAIASLLAQRHPAIEIVVVDDGSVDGSAAVARRFGEPVQYHAQQHAGVAAARNAGLLQACGELIGFLDQDDLWAEDKLEVLLPYFAADDSLEAVYGLTRCVGVGARAGAPPQFDMNLGSALFRRSLLECLGGLDETVRYFADDTDLFLRLRERKARVAYVDRVTLTYRLHGGNTSLNMSTPPRIFLVEILKRSLDRRRHASDMSVSPLPDFIRALTAPPRSEDDRG
jgi:glycosyltransferase involved in cell wall biosynthesis